MCLKRRRICGEAEEVEVLGDRKLGVAASKARLGLPGGVLEDAACDAESFAGQIFGVGGGQVDGGRGNVVGLTDAA